MIGVVTPSCQLGFVLQLLEEDGSWVTAHLHLLHPLLMDFFDSGVLEHCLEFSDEIIPMWVLILWAGGISIVSDPKVFPSMGPPMLGAFDEERGGKDYHEQQYSSELVAEHFKVRVAVTDETVHVIVLSFEGLG